MNVWHWWARRGRISRRTFWLHYVAPIAGLALLAWLLDEALGLLDVAVVTQAGTLLSHPTGPLTFLVTNLTFVPLVSAVVARLHDRGDPAWALLLLLVPFLGAVLLLVLVGFREGAPEPNRYGPAPDRVPAGYSPRAAAISVRR